MRYLYRRGHGARRRVMHLTLYDPVTGKPAMEPLCGTGQAFNTTSNVPWGQPTCKRCAKAAGSAPVKLVIPIVPHARGRDRHPIPGDPSRLRPDDG